MKSGTILPAAAVVLLPLLACGAPKTHVDAPSGNAAAADAGPATSAAPKPAERPFAATPVEAQSIIQGQIDQRMKTLWKCVADYRTRKADPHGAVVVDIGIDQEGTLLGVTSANPKQGDLEPTLKDCVFTTLHGMPFPRSHAGVITVRQTFSDATVTP